MSKIDSSEDTVQEEENKKNKLFTAYRIPMVGGSSFYGITHPPASGESSSDGGGSGGGE